MFTGLIEQRLRVIDNRLGDKANRLLIERLPATDYEPGESIAINGVCLTLLPDDEQHLAFDVSPETLRLTTLGQASVGDYVNMERAMRANGRFGGHYVSGHVDTSACVSGLNPVGDYLELVVTDFAMPAAAYLLPKGSITLDGVSLTINEIRGDNVHLMLIPHTLEQTTFGQMQTGQRLNVEFDYLTRIVAHQLALAGQLKSEV